MLWLRHKRNSLLSKTESGKIKDIVFDDDSRNLDLLFEKSDVLHEPLIWPNEISNEISVLYDSAIENIVDAGES